MVRCITICRGDQAHTVVIICTTWCTAKHGRPKWAPCCKFHWNRELPEKYCHVFGVCVMNNNGFCIRWLDLLALFYNYDQLQQLTTRSIPYWTTSCLLFHCDEWWRKNLCWMDLLSVRMCSPLTTSGEPNRGHPFQQFTLLRAYMFNGNVCCDLLPSNGGPSTVNCVTFQRVYRSVV
jgi:hypothetical protein